MKRNIFICLIIIFPSCNNQKKTGIEGNNNSNNTVIIAEKVEVPDEEARKYKFDYNITSTGVGGINMGEPIDEVQHFFHKNTNFSFETNEGARAEGTDFDFPTIYIKDSTNTAIFSLRSNMKIVDGFEVYSNKFKTYNGIHVGMSVSDFSALYQGNLILYADELNDMEYFAPFDLQGSKTMMYLYISVEEDKNASILKSGMSYNNKESNYEKKGVISSIWIAEGEN